MFIWVCIYICIYVYIYTYVFIYNSPSIFYLSSNSSNICYLLKFIYVFDNEMYYSSMVKYFPDDENGKIWEKAMVIHGSIITIVDVW